MRITASIIFSLICSISFSQKQIGIYSELSQSFPKIMFTETNLSLGVSMPISIGMISTFIQYQFGGNYKIKREGNFKAYEIQYQMLGGGLKYRFLSKMKLYSPTLKISAATELTSNYRGGYLYSRINAYNKEYYSFFPTRNHEIEKVTYDGELYNTYNYVYYYVSTPLVLSILVGHEFRLTKGLNFNVGIGYSARAVKARLKKWGAGTTEPPSDISKTHSMQGVKWFHMIDLNLGFNYTFPIKKKE